MLSPPIPSLPLTGILTVCGRLCWPSGIPEVIDIPLAHYGRMMSFITLPFLVGDGNLGLRILILGLQILVSCNSFAEYIRFRSTGKVHKLRQILIELLVGIKSEARHTCTSVQQFILQMQEVLLSKSDTNHLHHCLLSPSVHPQDEIDSHLTVNLTLPPLTI